MKAWLIKTVLHSAIKLALPYLKAMVEKTDNRVDNYVVEILEEVVGKAKEEGKL